jgi:hypothetical protein
MEQLIKDAEEILEDGINPDTGLPLTMEEYVAVEKELKRLKLFLQNARILT